jgi:hypothetical protein
MQDEVSEEVVGMWYAFRSSNPPLESENEALYFWGP